MSCRSSGRKTFLRVISAAIAYAEEVDHDLRPCAEHDDGRYVNDCQERAVTKDLEAFHVSCDEVCMFIVGVFFWL